MKKIAKMYRVSVISLIDNGLLEEGFTPNIEQAEKYKKYLTKKHDELCKVEIEEVMTSEDNP